MATSTYKKALNLQLQALTSQAELPGRLNQQRYKSLENLDPQWTSRFEIILYPAPASFGFVAGDANEVASITKAIMSADDMNVVNLNARSISIPPNKFEYDTDGSGKKYLKNVVYADSVTIEFMEDQNGSVRSLMERWIEEVGVLDKVHKDLPQQAYLFKEKQNNARKNARVLLLNDIGKPTGGMFSIFGLRPSDIGEVTLAHNSGDPLIQSIVFAVDYVDYGSMGGSIGGLVKKVLGNII